MTGLYVLRHGIAVPRGTPDIADDDRPLTPKGRDRTRDVGRGLRRLGIKPDRISSSPLPRAWQTAEIIADALSMSHRLEAAEPLRADAGPEAIRDWLTTLAEDRLLIVGHNPGLSDLVPLLLTGKADAFRCDLKKGAVAAFSSSSPGTFALEWLASPRILRRVGGS